MPEQRLERTRDSYPSINDRIDGIGLKESNNNIWFGGFIIGFICATILAIVIVRFVA